MEQQRQFGAQRSAPPQQQYQSIQGSSRGFTSQIRGLQNSPGQNVGSRQGSSGNVTSRLLGLVRPSGQIAGSIQGSSRSRSMTTSQNRQMFSLQMPSSQNVGFLPGSSRGITSQMMGTQMLTGQNVSRQLPYPMWQTSSTQQMPTQSHLQPLLYPTGSASAAALQQTRPVNHKRAFRVMPQLSDIPMISQKIQEPWYKKQRYQQGSGLPSLPSSDVTVLQQQHVPMDIQRVKTTHESDLTLAICTQRFINYMLKLQERPKDNNIDFWRNFVSEFYAEHAMKRWCVSLYRQKLKGVAEQKAWSCGLCQINPGRGFEVSVEALPRLFKVMYDSGTVKEEYHMENPSAFKASKSGLHVLQCANVKHETVYENRIVIHKGRLCIIFTPDLKIWTWEFCAHHHDEFIRRRDFMLQIGDLSQSDKDNGDDKNRSRLPAQEKEISLRNANSANQSNKAKKNSLHAQGYEKQYVRVLEVPEVLNLLTDLFKFTSETGTPPLEAMAEYNSAFNMLIGNKDSVQESQLLHEQPQSTQPIAEDVTIIQTPSPAPSFDPLTQSGNQMNIPYFPGYGPATNQLPFVDPSNLSVTTQPSQSFAMAPLSSKISPMEMCDQQGGASSLAPNIIAANLSIKTDMISSLPVSSNEVLLDSPNSVAKMFEESVKNSEFGGHDGLGTVGNADNNVNGNRVEINLDSNSRGKEVIVDNNPRIPEDFEFEQQLLYFVEGENAPNAFIDF